MGAVELICQLCCRVWTQIPRAAIVLLHSPSDGSRHQFLFEHLMRMLPAMAPVVLRYDRRRMSEDRDVPYMLQVEDLTHGLDLIGERSGQFRRACVGSGQGAWGALLASAGEAATKYPIGVGDDAKHLR